MQNAYAGGFRAVDGNTFCVEVPDGVDHIISDVTSYLDIESSNHPRCEVTEGILGHAIYVQEGQKIMIDKANSQFLKIRVRQPVYGKTSFSFAFRFGGPSLKVPLVNIFDHLTTHSTSEGSFAIQWCPYNKGTPRVVIPPSSTATEYPVYISTSHLVPRSMMPALGTSEDGFSWFGNVSVEEGTIGLPFDNIKGSDTGIVYVHIEGLTSFKQVNPLLDDEFYSEKLSSFTAISGKSERLHGFCPHVIRFDELQSFSFDSQLAYFANGRVVLANNQKDNQSLMPDFGQDQPISYGRGTTPATHMIIWPMNPTQASATVDYVLYKNAISYSTEEVFNGIESDELLTFLRPGENRSFVIGGTLIPSEKQVLCAQVTRQRGLSTPPVEATLFSDRVHSMIFFLPSFGTMDNGDTSSITCVSSESKFAQLVQTPSEDTVPRSVRYFQPKMDSLVYLDNGNYGIYKSIPVATAQNGGAIQNGIYYNMPFDDTSFFVIELVFTAKGKTLFTEANADGMPKITVRSYCRIEDSCYDRSIGVQVGRYVIIPKNMIADVITDIPTDNENAILSLLSITMEFPGNTGISGLKVDAFVHYNDTQIKEISSITSVRQEYANTAHRNAGVFAPISFPLDVVRESSDVLVKTRAHEDFIGSLLFVYPHLNVPPEMVCKDGRHEAPPGQVNIFSDPMFLRNYECLYVYRCMATSQTNATQVVKVCPKATDYTFSYQVIDHTVRLTVEPESGRTDHLMTRVWFMKGNDSVPALDDMIQMDSIEHSNGSFFQHITPEEATYFGRQYVIVGITDLTTRQTVMKRHEIHVFEFATSHLFTAVPTNEYIKFAQTDNRQYNDILVAFSTGARPEDEDYDVSQPCETIGNELIAHLNLSNHDPHQEVPVFLRWGQFNFFTGTGKRSQEFSDYNQILDNEFDFLFENDRMTFTVTIEPTTVVASNVWVGIVRENQCTRQYENLGPIGTHTLTKKYETDDLCVASPWGTQIRKIPMASSLDFTKSMIDYNVDFVYDADVPEGSRISHEVASIGVPCAFSGMQSGSNIVMNVKNSSLRYCFEVVTEAQQVTTRLWQDIETMPFTKNDTHSFKVGYTKEDFYADTVDVPILVANEACTKTTVGTLRDEQGPHHIRWTVSGLQLANNLIPMCFVSENEPWRKQNMLGPGTEIDAERLPKVKKMIYDAVNNSLTAVLTHKNIICRGSSCSIGISRCGTCQNPDGSFSDSVEMQYTYTSEDVQQFVWQWDATTFHYSDFRICVSDQDSIHEIPFPPPHIMDASDETINDVVRLTHESGDATVRVHASSGDCRSTTEYELAPIEVSDGLSIFSASAQSHPFCFTARTQNSDESAILVTIFSYSAEYIQPGVAEEGTYYDSFTTIGVDMTNQILPKAIGVGDCSFSMEKVNLAPYLTAGKLVFTDTAVSEVETQGTRKYCLFWSDRNASSISAIYNNFGDKGSLCHFEWDRRSFVMDKNGFTGEFGSNCVMLESGSYVVAPSNMDPSTVSMDEAVAFSQIPHKHSVTATMTYESEMSLYIFGNNHVTELPVINPVQSDFTLYYYNNKTALCFHSDYPSLSTWYRASLNLDIGPEYHVENDITFERESVTAEGGSIIKVDPSVSNMSISFPSNLFTDAVKVVLVNSSAECGPKTQFGPISVQQDSFGRKFAAVDVRGISPNQPFYVCLANENLTNIALGVGNRSNYWNNQDIVLDEEALSVEFLASETIVTVNSDHMSIFGPMTRIGGKEIDPTGSVSLDSGINQVEITSLEGVPGSQRITFPEPESNKLQVLYMNDQVHCSLKLSHETDTVSYGLNAMCENPKPHHPKIASLDSDGRSAVFVLEQHQSVRNACVVAQQGRGTTYIGTIVFSTLPGEVDSELIGDVLHLNMAPETVGKQAVLVGDANECLSASFEDENVSGKLGSLDVEITGVADAAQQGKVMCLLLRPNEIAAVKLKTVKGARSFEESSLNQTMKSVFLWIGLAIAVTVVAVLIGKGVPKKAFKAVKSLFT